MSQLDSCLFFLEEKKGDIVILLVCIKPLTHFQNASLEIPWIHLYQILARHAVASNLAEYKHGHQMLRTSFQYRTITMGRKFLILFEMLSEFLQ